MNKKALYELAGFLSCDRYFDLKQFRMVRYSPAQIMDSYPYKRFKRDFPEICRLIETDIEVPVYPGHVEVVVDVAQ
jgi:hypothetical protein